MLIHEIVLHNFGGYRGRHIIDLAPPSPDRPVVLFGGLNGAGKTTLLDAMQLVLYGKRARCSGRGTLGYEEYLKRCIHRAVASREGAAIEISFEATFADQPSTFRVHRSWETTDGDSVREHLAVERDGIEALLLTERWDELVEELIPLDISSLFFFDGEKIEALADPARAGRVIGTAVETLLGLNLLDRLSVDLVALERRKRAISADSKTRSQLAELEQKVASAKAERARALQEQAARRNEVDRADAAARRAHHTFKREGGELYERRAEIDQRRSIILERLSHVEARLVDAASGVLPLRLVAGLLDQVAEQRRLEHEAERAALVGEVLVDRDAALLKSLKDNLEKADVARLRKYLERDRKERAKAAQVDIYLSGTEGLDHRLAAVMAGELDASAQLTRKLLKERRELEADLEEVDRELAAVPSEDAIASASRRCDEADAFLAEVRARHKVAADVVAEAEKIVNDHETQLERAFRDATSSIAAEDDAARIVDHATRVRGTIRLFREQLLQRHLSSIETAVLDSLRRLLRKQKLVDDLRIDPDSYEIDLFDSHGRPVPTERLSAGERQLLAVALLWGLARVSGRTLPTVIDTPLGRLDSTHRRLIAERYFPEASHQVLLLSTDEEIDQELLAVLEPRIGRCYELQHDDAAGSTSVVEGYFWTEASDVA